MMLGPFVKRPARRIVLAASTVLFGTFQLCGALGLRFNLSPSLPLGMYATMDQTNTNLVEFCPAEPFASLMIERGYRPQGACPDGAAPLLKPVVAAQGDVVHVSERGIYVNGVLIPNSAPLPRDTKGRLLSAWQEGPSVVEPGTIWVASSYNPRSFDSRYFGPIQTRACSH